jgi:autotransporter-associated beta strand protein
MKILSLVVVFAGGSLARANNVSDSLKIRPNIIVIICDDAGYADFGFMDGISGSKSQVPTPHLDALAARGITFSRAYVAANCQPTRAAIVTGAYQARIGNENVGNDNFRAEQLFEGVPVEVDTVWDRMRNLGYTTGAIGKWHLGSIENAPGKPGNRPENQGIDQFFGFWHGSREFMAGHYKKNTDPKNPLQLRYLREALIHPDGSRTNVVKEYSDYYDKRKEAHPPAQYLTNILGDYAEKFVTDHHDDGKPFFLYVAHPAPHKPWTNNSPDYDDPRISGLTPNNRRQVASMMITMDKEIGDLMARLDDPNGDGNTTDSIKDNTLVVFINDNGGVAGMENGVNGTSNGILNGFKGSAHDGGIRVPMIMAGAGIDASKKGTVYHKPVHGIDLTPTSVALAGGTLDPVKDPIDGVNLLPFINGNNPANPHDLLVHRWRGTFAVIKGDLKLVNTRNVNADPSHYQLYNVASDRSETRDLIDDAANNELVEELKHALTDHEAIWDKPQYPILNRTLESEPLNLVDHFTFRPGLHRDWSAGADEQDGPTAINPANWFEGGTTNPEYLLRSDGFSGAILELPVSDANYTSNNDLKRKTGMEFMLNKMILSGNHPGNARLARITGLPVIFTSNLQGEVPAIAVTANGDFSYHLDLNLILYHDLTITGNGTVPLKIEGDLSQHFTSRGIKKTGTSNAECNGARTYSGDTQVLGGTLKIAQINTEDEASSFRLVSTATLDLTYSGTDTIDKLFLDGVQQPAGVYGAELAQITGTGTLTVTSGPGG